MKFSYLSNAKSDCHCKVNVALLLFFTMILSTVFHISITVAQSQGKDNLRLTHSSQSVDSKFLVKKSNWISSFENYNTSKTTTVAKCGGGGNKPYHFSGKLGFRYDENNDGTEEFIPLEGVQIRIVRKGSPLKWAQGPDAVTGTNGNYNVTCTFARDRNGVAPGGKKIRFKVMARFRDDEFKIRKAGWAKNNWFKVGQENGCNRSGGIATSKCKDNDIKNDKTFDTNNTGGKQAYMWWFYNDLQDRMQQENIGLTHRPLFKRNLTITYPEKSIHQGGSSYLFNVHLEQGDWESKRTMIHEYMHRWDIGKLGGEGHVSCLVDAHHKRPENIRSSRCSGFMEGFAEAAAAGLEQQWYNGNINLHSHADLRSGNLGYVKAEHNHPVEDLNQAERSDHGWENFIKLIIQDNEMAVVNGSASCDPKDVGIFELLQVLQEDKSRKADWYKIRPNATFSWFTGILKEHISDFTERDAEIYQKLGDPSLSASEVCGSEATSSHSIVIKGDGNRGGTDYTLQGGGRLDQIEGTLSGYQVTIQSNDNVDGNKAQGHVAGGNDGFAVFGELPSIKLENPKNAEIYVDGDLYNPRKRQESVSLEYGYNRGGSDYKNFKMDNPKPQVCRDACANEEKCKAYTYVPPGRQGSKARCWLKDGMPNRNKSKGLVSGIKGTDPILNVTIENGYNRGGSDYRNFKMNNPKPRLCRKACAKEEKCKAYTYVPPGRQGPKARCWLKNSAPNKTKDSELVSGIKEE